METAGIRLRTLALGGALLLFATTAGAMQKSETPASRITIQHDTGSVRIEIRQPRVWLYIVPSAAAAAFCAWIFVNLLSNMLRGRTVSLGLIVALLLSVVFVLGFTYSLLWLWAGSDIVVLGSGRVEVGAEILGVRIRVPDTYSSRVKEVRVAASQFRSESGGFQQVELDFEDGSVNWIHSFLDRAEADRLADEIRKWKEQAGKPTASGPAAEASGPGQVVAEYMRALRARDVAALKRICLDEEMRRIEGPDGKEYMQSNGDRLEPGLEIARVYEYPDWAEVEVEKKDGSGKESVNVIRVDGSWKIR